VTEGPVGTRHAGAGDANEPPEKNQQVGRNGRRDGESLISAYRG